MALRNRFGPRTLEALEARIALSVAAPAEVRHAAPAAAVARPTPPPTVGALGDSYTDEYRFYGPDQSQARNWVEILAATNKANFGAFSTRSRGEPRDQGFANNWARYASTSSQLIANQLPGLKAQVKAGQVQYAWIFTGGNDFLYFLQDAAKGGANQSLTALENQLAKVEATAARNFNTAVSSLLSANRNVKLVVATVPDVADLPAVQQAMAGNPGAQLLVNAASAQVQKYNAVIRAAAKNPRVALADLAAESVSLFGGQGSTVKFGGATISLTTPGDSYNHAFLADGIHVGTVVQGVIADQFIIAIDAKFKAKVVQLSPTQIVAFAKSIKPSTV